MQPRPNTAINNYDMPFVHARWEAERAMNGGGQVTAGQGTSSPRLCLNGQVPEVGVRGMTRMKTWAIEP